MLIIADENMPFAREWFSPYGQVRTLSGRNLSADLVRDADALLVRSVTRVDEELLAGSRVRFVGSATSGIEHIDMVYLQRQGIGCASSAGCNATAVVEYVLSSLCALEGALEKLLNGGVVGVIGLGNVGSRLIRRLQALDIDCIGHDPLLEKADANALPLASFDTVLQADVICCHTPLTKTGEYPTWHLLDESRMKALRRDAVIINASRGAVVDNVALLRLLRERDDLRAVLDVWEGEPAIDRELLHEVSLATPHVAGYSWDGKVKGTRMVLAAFCDFFKLPLDVPAEASSGPTINLPTDVNSATLLRSAIGGVYDVRRDDRTMREALAKCAQNEISAVFDELRKNYPQRREIAACTIDNWNALSAVDRSLLQRLGFAGS